MSLVRWGICSSGKIAHDFVTALKTLPVSEHQVCAVGARNLERAQEFAKRHSIPKAFGSYEELANDPEIDAVYVGNIHTGHVEVSIMMMKHSKAVLCEKPFGVNAREVRQAIAVARERGVFLMEAVWSRFLPSWLEVKSQITSGAVGDVRMVLVNFGFSMGDKLIENLVRKDMAGGAILDIGIYALTFASFVYGDEKPVEVKAAGNLLETGVDEQVGITLVYSGGRVANLAVSIGANMPSEAVVVGTKGSIKLPYPFWCATKVETPSGLKEFPLPVATGEDYYNFTNSSGLRYEAEEVRKCLLAGKKESDSLSLAKTESIALLMDEVRRQVGVVYPQDEK
eukprot:m.161271 g.161271  ORF g.161271 m.161271 type:complete len:340 (+) comp38812_c3_seq7:19-1038(+)